MSYTPIVPASGYAGWKLLNRTMAAQKTAFTSSAEMQRDEDYFREKIGSITTAEDLVSDRRLLKIALGAFGLEADIDNKFFIRKILEEGTQDTEALANKLADKTYLKLSQAFGFGDYTTPRTALSGFADEVLASYETRQFEVAVGEADDSLRLALAAERELPELAAGTSSDNAKWYSIIASKSLSTVLRGALALPESVSSLNVDQQLTIYKNKADRVLGSTNAGDLGNTDMLEKVIRLYLVRSQVDIASAAATGQAVALQLLQGGATPGTTTATLSLLL